MKKILDYLSILIIIVGFLIIRYPLFYLHGMKQYTLFLFAIAFAISFIFTINKNTIIPMFTAIGYVVGFFLGLIFKTYSYDSGGGIENNLWIIWAGVMLGLIIIGVAASIFKTNRNSR